MFMTIRQSCKFRCEEFLATLSILLLATMASAPCRADEPRFSFRAWETQVDGLWCEPRGDSLYWYKNEFYLKYLDRVLEEAPKYGVNALVLMGRGDFAEVHTFISYRSHPRLHALYEAQGREDRELQIRRLNELVEKGKQQGVDIYLWTHELHIPPELVEEYPAVAGTGAPFCPSEPELWRFVSEKYSELLDRVPGLAGMFLVLSESQSVLLEGSPCKCDRCQHASPIDPLEKAIRAVHTPLQQRGKRLIVRTFGQSLDHIRTICDAINLLPADLDVTVMSKATPCDFFGLRYPDNPAFTAIQDRPQYLEEVFGEFRGNTNIICTPAEFYCERIRRAAKNGVDGIVMRLEHQGFRESNFDTPNQFNLALVAELCRNPETDSDQVWQEWFADRYGPKVGTLLIPAFRNTESIWELATNTLGAYSMSAHGNLAPLYRGPYNAWENLNLSISGLTKGYPEWDAIGAELLKPNDETLTRIENEIDKANRLADESLALVRQAGPLLKKADLSELETYFVALRDAAKVFGQLKKLFFLGLQAEQSDESCRVEKVELALRESQLAIRNVLEIEKKRGRNPWPLKPDTFRGSEFYNLLVDYWTEHLTLLSVDKSIPKGGWEYQLGARSAAGKLWHKLLDSARPEAPETQSLNFMLDKQTSKLEFAGDRLILTTLDGNTTFEWPMGQQVDGPVLHAGVTYVISIENKQDRTTVTAVPKPNLDQSLGCYQNRRLDQGQRLRGELKSPEDLDGYRKQVRENFQSLLGPWPEKTPLKPQLTGVLERDGYRIEKILLQSRPGFYVPVNLYLPTGRDGPLPAVLSPLGHAPAGKAHWTKDNFQARFVTLARKGYIVCAFDPLGQGEREPYAAKTGNHHMIQGYQCMPTGRHLAQYFIWDGIRCLDYLQSRPEVDAKRIACAGCSGGGALTNYIAALDDRVAVAVPTSWITESNTLIYDDGLHTESWFPDMNGPDGPGTRQLLACIAPRPMLILGNRDDDEFPPESMRAVYEDTKMLYEQLGMPGHLEYISVPTPHGFWPEARRELYRFLNQHLGNEDEGAEEPPVTPEAEADLYCAPGGQVRNISGAQTVYSLNRTYMETLRAVRKARRGQLSFDAYRNTIRDGVIESIRYAPTLGPLGVHLLSETHGRNGVRTDELVLEYEPGFSERGDLYMPIDAADAVAVVLISDDNATGREFARGLRSSGFHVLHMHTSKTEDRIAIMSGKPQCERWVNQLLRGAAYLTQQAEADPFDQQPVDKHLGVVAIGIGPAAAQSAQFAGLIEEDSFAGIAAVKGLDSVESLSEGIAESHSLQMLPGALQWFDGIDLAAALAPQPLLLAEVKDKHGQQLSEEGMHHRYQWPQDRYAETQQAALRLAPGECSADRLAEWLTSLSRNSKHPRKGLQTNLPSSRLPCSLN